MFDRKKYEQRVAWFKEARFGMFIHYGLYSYCGRGEWVRSNEEMPFEQYQPYFDMFEAENADFNLWAKKAKEAGMQYMVMTARHHDGFCLFDSKTTDYKSTNTKANRDLVKEFVEAVRNAGLKVGLYYSIIDWMHPDYPHYGDLHHPDRNRKECSNENRDFDRYLDMMHAQVKELVTNYGKLDILWFDFAYKDMRGEKWKATELINMVRTYQPDVLIDNRLESSTGYGYGSLYQCQPTAYHGDFVTPEQLIPLKGIRDVEGNPMVWEACVTMNEHWGYFIEDHDYKPAAMLIHKLVECVSKGGNMLLNVGPLGDGSFPKESDEILEAFKKWMSKNEESIVGCGLSDLPKPEYGRFTQKGNILYYHVYENAIGPLPLLGVRKEDIVSIELLETKEKIEISTSWVTGDYPNVVFIDMKHGPELVNEIDTVIKIELKEGWVCTM